jgi:hypothetical protein
MEELGKLSGFPGPGSRNRVRGDFLGKIKGLGRFSGFSGPGSTNRVRNDFVKEIDELGRFFLDFQAQAPEIDLGVILYRKSRS